MSNRNKTAQCGTYEARRRHKRKNETCEKCGPIQPRQIAPCGTKQARERHRRNKETCTTCDDARNITPLAPCGTPSARRRHRGRGETCDTCGPIREYKPRKHNPCGTEQAYKRHKYRGEEPCETCATAHNERTGHHSKITIEDLIAEIRFLVNAGEGTHRILQATGYLGREGTLRSRLTQAGQHHLAQQALNPWDLAA